MSEILDDLQRQHQEWLGMLHQGETGAAFLDGVRMFIGDLRQAGEGVADSAGRAALRALARFWAGVVYERSGIYPNTTLLPPAAALMRPVEEAPRPSTPRLVWLLVGGAAAIVMLVGGLFVAWAVTREAPGAHEALPTPGAAPFVLQSAVGTGLGESGVLTETGRSFCLGVPELVATFVLQGVRTESELRWELLRDGQLTAAEPAAPWGEGFQYVTIRMQGEPTEGLLPGEYELRLYASEQPVARQAFEVLEDAPQVNGLQVSDVPAATAPTTRQFDAGLRVVYLDYDYAGLCTGLRLSHALSRDGSTLDSQSEIWSGPARGHRQVVFQAGSGVEFTPGDYEVVLKIGDREQGRVRFSIAEPVAETAAEVRPQLPPAFGDITLALGAYPNGTPILPSQDVPFDWNTKVVYAIFDYQGLADGMTWAAVWTRNEQEVARQEGRWDLDSAGSEGTTWVAYFDPNGRPIPGGNYSVTLFLDDVPQSSASFTVRFYVPAQ